MQNQAMQTEDAETVFRRKFRQRFAARGYRGEELDRKVDKFMNAPVRFQLDLGETPCC